MLRRIAMLWGACALLALSAPACNTSEGSTEEIEAAKKAVEDEQKAVLLFKRLGRYRQSYLSRWEPVFAAEKQKSCDVIDAFYDLATQMTGPDGLWRNEVPDEWLDCAAEEKIGNPACVRLNGHLKKFLDLDEFLEKILRVEPSRAGEFLIENLDKIYEFMDIYVMKTPTPEGMRRTKFYTSVLERLPR